MKGQDIQIKSNAKGKDNDMPKKPKVAIVMGSDSDFPVMEGCLNILKEFDVETSVAICSADRTPDRAAEIARNAESEGCDLIIGAAGKAAHLPGVLAAYTVLPVIRIPIKSSTLDGLDSLHPSFRCLRACQWHCSHKRKRKCLLAIQILGGTCDLREKMREYKKDG